MVQGILIGIFIPVLILLVIDIIKNNKERRKRSKTINETYEIQLEEMHQRHFKQLVADVTFKKFLDKKDLVEPLKLNNGVVVEICKNKTWGSSKTVVSILYHINKKINFVDIYDSEELFSCHSKGLDFNKYTKDELTEFDWIITEIKEFIDRIEKDEKDFIEKIKNNENVKSIKYHKGELEYLNPVTFNINKVFNHK